MRLKGQYPRPYRIKTLTKQFVSGLVNLNEGPDNWCRFSKNTKKDPAVAASDETDKNDDITA